MVREVFNLKSQLKIITEKVQTIGNDDLISEITDYLRDIIDDDFIEQNGIDDLLMELGDHLNCVLVQDVDS